MNKITQPTGVQSHENQPDGVADDPVVEGHLTELAEILVEFWLRQQRRRKGRRGKQTSAALHRQP